MASTKNTVSSNYNTRRKSLSLPSLGINLPVSHASRHVARSSTSPNAEQPPTKKLKRSHDEDSKSSCPKSPPAKRQSISKPTYEHTPPPSPETQAIHEENIKVEPIDLEGINDEIVEGVIVQLQETGNRPHLVKQLAELLHKSVRIVEQSANPSAIISSRLSSYLKRTCWTSTNPCPLAKELETVHPRRTYFYLTTCPHQPIPDPAATAALNSRSLTSPPLSTAHSRSDEAEAERRRELSPSPEVDLSVHELDDMDMDDESLAAPPTPTGSFSGFPGHLSQPSSKQNASSRNHRATSPPLDKDEKEFTQTANGMSRRKFSGSSTNIQPSIEAPPPSSAVPEIQVNSSKGDEHNLFGLGGNKTSNMNNVASPALRPTKTIERKLTENTSLDGDFLARAEVVQWDGGMDSDWDTRSPELVDLDELDGMFEDF